MIDKCIFISIAAADNNSFDKQHEQLSDLYRISVKVTREDVPVIWIAGDSTLTDQNAGVPYYPYGSCAGWAQTLARFIDKALRNKDNEEVLNEVRNDVIALMAKHPYLED